ncbi:hypothetical protein ACLIIZ_17380 [Azonexus caeni]|jgi:hypothetical protein|uniref:hypothetical protein n=1 Tax=Azonexus caeni TaxID=266126 RepID=UPI003A8B5AFA
MNNPAEQTPETPVQATAQQNDAVSLQRREAMRKIAQRASYIAPATLALFSMQARAS